MKVKLSKAYALSLGATKKAKGTILTVTGDFGRELIKAKVAKEYKGESTDEKLLKDAVDHSEDN